ncbi:bifunctional levopimaradiene synthase, chloroplastic [Dorcoceras hygrometricum]|uniref:Bifunctional levopimaradiene synthase, chloroplastic n=1 Tax=Dorcoceras hygrometricum TaxID=472368 RepID=A0A2Z7D145_9LAMI|nr:bifunctional levopimaradiene synthase, chloroplastic [Dorcoceras hygrometricum]
MAYSLIANALQVNFDSVLDIPDNDGMVKMFRALESTGLCGSGMSIIYLLGVLSFYLLYEMAYSLIANALQVNFDSVLDIPDNDGMVKMFRALESTGLCGSGMSVVVITEERFEGVFELPTEGLTDLSEVPKNLVFHARSLFSRSGEPVKTSCKKREMKYEFRLLNDTLAM